jgi:hypothetical protein
LLRWFNYHLKNAKWERRLVSICSLPYTLRPESC